MLVGLTGGISTGKSTVAKIFANYGIPVIDVDQIAKEIVRPKQEGWRLIVEYFGQDILLPDLSINRAELGEIIFNNSEKRKKLNEITHPIIMTETIEKAKLLEEKSDIVIVDIPLLFEAGAESIFDKIIVVYMDENRQLSRLMDRDKISLEAAKLKMKSQLDINIKKDKADILINNNSTIEETEEQVKRIVKQLREELNN